MPKLNLATADEGFTGGDVNSLVAEGVYEATVTSSKFEIDDRGRERIITDFEVTQQGVSLEQLENVGVPANWNYKNTGALEGKDCRIKLIQDGEYMSVKSIIQRAIPSGTYTCRVVKVSDEQKSYTKGTPFRIVFFAIQNAGVFQGLKILERLFLTDKSLKVTASKLKSMGAEVAEFDTDNDRDWGSLTGLNVELNYAITRDSDGTERGRIVRYTKLGRGNVAAPATSAPAEAAHDPNEVDVADVAGMASAEVEEVEDNIPF
jgi:hypothetical protein